MQVKRRAALPFLPRGKKRKVAASPLIISGAPRKPGEVLEKKTKLTLKDLRKMRREARKAEKAKRAKTGLKALKAEIEALKTGVEFPTAQINEVLNRRKAEIKAKKIGAALSQMGDSSNLHVGNVPSHITEKDFMNVFSLFGEITSVRFMAGRESNHAFCNYRTRQQAEYAMQSLQENQVWGANLKFDWGKKLENEMQLIVNAPPAQNPNIYYSKGKARPYLRFPKSDTFPPLGHPRVQVKFPSDSRRRQIIDCLSEHVAMYGMAFENVAISKVNSGQTDHQEDFSFLLAVDSTDHMYYRWRLWSLAMGETLDRWTPEPFQMMQGGPFWIPPPLENRKLLNADPSTLQNVPAPPPRPMPQFAAQPVPPPPPPRNPFDMLECQRTALFEHLQQINPTRKSVRKVLHYCISNHNHAQEICDILHQSMATKKPNYDRKLARLYLVNDLLFNSQMSKSGKPFRGFLKQKLEGIFEHLHNLLDNTLEKDQKEFHTNVVQVLNVWEKNTLYTKPYLDRLRNCFLNGPKPAANEKAVKKSAQTT